MSRSFERSFAKLLGVEGDLSDHPDDGGGKTRYGITEEVARENGYEGEMSELPLEFAKEIYKKLYWDKNNLSKVANLNESVACELFDTGVNCGVKVAGKFFQRSLNLFNKSNQETPLYEELEVDGIIGDKTIKAFTEFHRIRGAKGISVMQKSLNGLQVAYYFRIAEKDEKYESFTFGWILNRT